jgi:16S rRNA (guanine527-N7)-methyltransferase
MPKVSSNNSITTFRETLKQEAETYNVVLSDEAVDRLTTYYELLKLWNERLHLVAPTSPQTFATRHILESLVLLEHLPIGARLIDVGSGAGLPSIPCLIVRDDIQAVLVEASKKKAIFLREALANAQVSERSTVIPERFENIATPDADFITSRALERFEDQVPKIITWAPNSTTLLFFGGKALGKRLEETGLATQSSLIPNSARRFLFMARKA